MNAVFSYKICSNFWKKRDENFYKLAYLASTYAGKYYNTVLYSDRYTKGVFDKVGITFNNYVTSDTLFKEVDEHNYGMSKLLALQDQTEEYIALDLDTIVFEKINSSKTVTYGLKEIDLTKNTTLSVKRQHLEYVEKHYLECHSFFKSRIPKLAPTLDWMTYPSNSLIQVNNADIMKNVVKEVIKLVNRDYKYITIQYYEQFIIYNYLKYLNVDIGFIYNNNPLVEHTDDINELISNKFLHIDAYYRDKGYLNAINILYDNSPGGLKFEHTGNKLT